MSLEGSKEEGSNQSFLELVQALQDGEADGRVPGSDSDSVQPRFIRNPQVSTPALDLFGGDADVEQLSDGLPADIFGEATNLHASVKPVRDDPPMSQADYNRALFEARLDALGDAGMKLPWDQGIWKTIFSDDDTDIFPTVLPPVPGEYIFQSSSAASASTDDVGASGTARISKSLSHLDSDVPLYSYAIKVLPDVDALQETDKLWSKALYKWQQVFEVLDYPGPLGRALLHEQVVTECDVDSVVLRDSLGIKSPRTAIKRAQTMLQYLTWLQLHFSTVSPWDRNQCLEFLRVDGRVRKSASRGMTLLEAFRFSRYVLEIPVPDELLRDPQLRGRAQRLMAEKQVYKPARPLKVSEVMLLEKAIQEPRNGIDLYMLGAVIFAILSRSRWSDLKYIDQIWLEKMEYNGELYGFVEARTKFHKTASTLAKKQRYMPLVAPVLGISGVDWTRYWLEACDSLGVSWGTEPFGALCRAAASDGTLCIRSCTTEEIGVFLNRILQTNVESAVTSHSLKHTTLSWCAAYGLDEPSRTLLGHHELQGAKAMAVYSRDLLTRPLQLYCSMLTNIRLDHFRPDESRTSRMVDLLKLGDGQHVAKSGHEQVLHGKKADESIRDDDSCVPTTPADVEPVPRARDDQLEEDSSDIASTDSSSSDSSSDDQHQDSARHIPGPVWRNLRSHVVHRCANLARQTSCGRLVDDAHFELLAEGCSTLNARCSRCFKGEIITDVSGLVNALDQGRAKRQRAE